MIAPVTILLGLVCGIIGFIPFVVALKLSRKAQKAGVGASMGVVLLGLAVSFIFLIACMLTVNDLYHDSVVMFVIFCAIGLSLSALSYGIYFNIKHK